jgi:hypothetical protein
MAATVRILEVLSVGDVQAADRLSVIRVLGYDAVVAKLPDGSHRYRPGDRVVYIPEGAKLPDRLLRELGFWRADPQTGIENGTLSGPRGAVVKPHVMRKQLSTGIAIDVPDELAHLPTTADVTDHFGVVEWIPPVPDEMLAYATSVYAAKNDLVFGRLKMYPDVLIEGEEIVITEKLEGENVQMTWLSTPVEGLFHGGHVSVTTKGMARQGLAFLDTPEARRVPVIRAVDRTDAVARFEHLVRRVASTQSRVRLHAEAIGPGVKFHYGESSPTMRGFDLMVDGRFLPEDARAAALAGSSIDRVPVLHRGPYSFDMLDAFREGQTMLGSKDMREGIVVTAVGEQDPRRTALGDMVRPSLKYHSDRFLRKFGIED